MGGRPPAPHPRTYSSSTGATPGTPRVADQRCTSSASPLNWSPPDIGPRCSAPPTVPRRREEVTPGGVRVVRRGGRHTVYLRAALIVPGRSAAASGPLAGRRLGRPDVIVDVGNGMPFLSPLYARRPVIALVHHVHREQWPVVLPGRRARLGWWIESRLAPRVYRTCRYVTVSAATRGDLAGARRRPGPSRGSSTTARPRRRRRRSARAATPIWWCWAGWCRTSGSRSRSHAGGQPRRGVARSRAGRGGSGLVGAASARSSPPISASTDRVRFTGFVGEEEKHALLGSAWVALMPSLKEGWGLTIVEAGARGTPTVAFRTAGGVDRGRRGRRDRIARR